MTKLRPFFSYFGGKYRVAPKYPNPRYDVIIEPFAGSAGYSVRHFDHIVILLDADPIICGVWDYLIHVSQKEVLRLPVGISHIDEVQAPQEAKWLVGFWLNKGTVIPHKTPSAWMRKSSSPYNFWGEPIRNRIASQVDIIRHWQIINCDYGQSGYNGMEATWFVDPPYAHASGSLYRFHDIDYRILGAWCTSLRGQAIVCERDGAEWLPFKQFATIKSTEGRHGKHQSKEVMWCNG